MQILHESRADKSGTENGERVLRKFLPFARTDLACYDWIAASVCPKDELLTTGNDAAKNAGILILAKTLPWQFGMTAWNAFPSSKAIHSAVSKASEMYGLKENCFDLNGKYAALIA